MMNRVKIQPNKGAVVKKEEATSEDAIEMIPPLFLKERVKKGFRNLWLRNNRKKASIFQPEKIQIDDDNIVEEEGTRIGSYSLQELLGEGGFGRVYLAQEDGADTQVAIKVQPNLSVSDDDDDLQKQVELECTLLKAHCHHPNIIGLCETICTRKHIYMVMEKCTVDLARLIQKESGRMQEDRWFSKQTDFRQQVMIGILKALDYLHERGIAHGDLKPDNILIQTTALDENYCLIPGRRIEASDIRVCDLGLCHISNKYNGSDTSGFKSLFGWSKKHRVTVTTKCGTRMYMAPECFGKSEYDGRHADMWSVGAILIRLCVLDSFLIRQWAGKGSCLRRRRKTYYNSCRSHGIEKKEADKLWSLVSAILMNPIPCMRHSSKVALKRPWFKLATRT